ncbi:hypothetical protein ACQ4PT_044573 [Festuca glaucescens]
MGIFSQDDEIGDVAATDAPSASCAQSSSAVVGRRRRREDLSGDGFDASSTRPARRRRREEPDPAILQSLTTMLNGCNPLVQTFRMAKDRMFSPDAPEVAVRLYGHEGADHGNRYSLPVAPELAALIVDDLTVEACSGTPEMQALPLKALSPDGPKRKIVVRVSRIWEAKKRDTGNVYELAFVAVDYEGTVMEGNVPAVNMAQFKDVLKEGTIYTIQGFMVKPARDRYKTVDHQHRITITQYTKVQEVLPEPHGVPLVAHCLQPLSVLEKRARNTIVLSENFDQESVRASSAQGSVAILFVSMNVDYYLGKLCFKGTFLTRSYINIPIPEMLALQTKYGTPNNQSCFAI